MGTANPHPTPKPKKNSFRERILKAIRMTLWNRKTFVGTYWDNETELRKFIADRNIIIVQVDRGKDKLHEFDFRLQGTEAAKKDRRITLYYVEDNYFMRKLGFRNAIAESMKYHR